MTSSRARREPAAVSPERAERQAAAGLGAAVHELASVAIARRPDAEVIASATELVRAATETLSATPAAQPDDPASIGGGADNYRARSPFHGSHHPFAQQLRWLSDVVGPKGAPALGFEVTIGDIFQGPPGAVHGGYVSALFDELLGAVQSRTPAGGGFTGRLEVRYRRPVPIDTPLRFEGWVTADRGRRILTAGRCIADDDLRSDAKALFVRPAPQPA